ncbi:hypothetical protein Bca52824_016780 [Brassica carinata]|uniref:Uncharacterized protein n=1 Tax=Brassica carinata TaxID=52824 RepID=A0A8X7W5Q3_BRACI|nr:hypothetical protein Bca52824_016780 [Brassica carinata]
MTVGRGRLKVALLAFVDVDIMERDDHPEHHRHRQASKSMNTPLVATQNKTVPNTAVHDFTDHNTDIVHNSPDHKSEGDQEMDAMEHDIDIVRDSLVHNSEGDQVESIFIRTIRHSPQVNRIITDEHKDTDNNPPTDQVEPVLSGTTSRPQQVTEVVTDEQNATDNQHPPEQDVHVMDTDVHQEPQSPIITQNVIDNDLRDEIQTTPAREETNQKTADTRTFGTLYPGFTTKSSFKMYTERRLDNQEKQIDQALLQIQMLLEAKKNIGGNNDDSALTT